MAKNKPRIVIDYFGLGITSDPGYHWTLLDAQGETGLQGPTRKTYNQAKRDALKAKRLMTEAEVQ